MTARGAAHAPPRPWHVLFLVGLVLATGVGCDGPAPRARAQRIAASAHLIGGPKAIGQIGDYLLENDQVRIVIHDKGPGRVNTLYGGTLVDADLVRPGGAGGTAGNDQVAEIVPAFMFEVIEPDDVRVTRDGSDGGPAEVTVRGRGSDLLQLAGLLVSGLLYPASLEFEQVYSLAPGERHVELRTSIINPPGSGAHPLPFVSPPDLPALGLDIPGIENLQLSVPMGHLLLLGGEQKLFVPGPAGFDVRFTLEEAYTTAGGFPAFPGLVGEFIASRGRGVSYGFAVPPEASNYVSAFASRYAPQPVTPTSLLLAFNYAAVIGVFTANPPAILQEGERFTFTSHFYVGRGDVASITDAIYADRGVATGTFAGRVVDGRAQSPVQTSIVVSNQDGYVTQLDSDADGNFRAQLPAGAYRYQIVDDSRPRAPEEPLSITVGVTTSRLIQLDPAATLALLILDPDGRPAPAKASLLARRDPADAGRDPRDFLYSLGLGEAIRPTAFDPDSDEYVEDAYYSADGRLLIHARPGEYDLVVSRGPEYDLYRQPIDLAAGTTTTREIRLVRAVDSVGWVGADVHLHSVASTDSGMPLATRVTHCAAEGLEVAVATEHNNVVDYQPAIDAAGLTEWLTGVVGVELTTFEMGHFNAYPLRVDPGSTRGGEFTWSRIGPADLFTQLRSLGEDPATTIVQVNHPRQQILGYFAQFFVDAETGDPYVPSGLRAVFAPYGDEFQPSAFSYDFDAIELITGKHLFEVHSYRAPDPLPPGPFPDPQPVPGEIVRGPDGRPTFPGTVETWFTLLDRGQRTAAMGSSDSHGADHEAGYARTMIYVGPDRDRVGGFTRQDLVDAIRTRRTISTNGPLVELFVDDAMIGDEVRVSGTVSVRVRVRAPAWAAPTRLTLWSNGGVAVGQRALPPTSGAPLDVTETFDLSLADDAWLVAEVSGDRSMFPIVTPREFEGLDATVVIKALGAGFDLSGLAPTGALQPSKTLRVTPLAFTSPIWVDVDGGGWTPPRPPLPDRAARQAPTQEPGVVPDVRDAFSRLPGVGL